MALLDKLREQYGVRPVCSELHIAPSTYYHCQQQRHHPDKRSAHAQRDDWLKREIQRVYDENHQVYGVRKVWRQLLREGIRVARCTVARLMAVMGLAGVLRGKKVRTTVSRKTVAAGDRVNRQCVAERPDQLWVADFTYVSTWQGFVYQPRHCFLDVGFRFGAVKLRQWLALFNNIANLDVEMIQNSAFQRLHHLFAPGGFYRAAAGGDFIKLEVPRPAEKTEQHHSGNAYRQRRTRQAGFSQATVVLQLSVHAADPLFFSCNTTRRAVGSLCSRKMASFAPSITIRP